MGITSKELGEDNHAVTNTEVILRPHIGQQITLKCIESKNGLTANPPPQLLFTKNGVAVGLPKHFENSLSFQVNSNDSGAMYACEAKNQIGKMFSNGIALDIPSKFSKGFVYLLISFWFYFVIKRHFDFYLHLKFQPL